jgi:putative methyltransferase
MWKILWAVLETLFLARATIRINNVVHDAIYLFQPQYEQGEGDHAEYWLPYSVACVWAYAQQFEDIKTNWVVEEIFYRRDPIDQVLSRLNDPKICAFSCYIWNEKYNLALAKAVKENWPKCTVVFGGPQTGGNHLQYEFIDSIIFGEGEQHFLEILRTVASGKKPEQFYQQKRLENLDVPSPYLTGVFDQIIKNAAPGSRFQAIIETNRGCPFSCTFCDWGGLTFSKVKKFSMGKVEQELIWMKNNPITVVFLADANTGIFKERDLEFAKMVRKHLTDSPESSVEWFNLNFTKNSNEIVFEIAKELGEIFRGVTLSVQSMNPTTLKAIKRDNMKSNDLQHMLSLSKKYNIPTYSEMILGLPEETYESWCSGLAELLELGQDNHIEIHPGLILENTELNHVQRASHQITTVPVKYYTIFSTGDSSGIDEGVELINSTSTMSTDEMVAAYMYHWMIQNFHNAGYSEILSKYVRHVKGEKYRKFYDNLIELIQNDRGSIGNEYNLTKSSVHNLLKTGQLNQQVEVQSFLKRGYLFFYEHLQQVNEMVVQNSLHFGHVDHSIIEAQKRSILNSIWKPMDCLKLNFNMETWNPGHYQYKITNSIVDFVPSYNSFYRARRSGKIKNTFTLI